MAPVKESSSKGEFLKRMVPVEENSSKGGFLKTMVPVKESSEQRRVPESHGSCKGKFQ